MFKLYSNLSSIKKEDLKLPLKNKNLHSKIHLLADEISLFFGERKKFGMYLGVIKRTGFDQTCRIFGEIKESKAKDPKKLFMWKTRKTQINTNGDANKHKESV